MMPSNADVWNGLLIEGLLLLFLVIAEVWWRCGNPSTEVTRKFVHICGGLTCVSFAFVIDSAIVVGVVCGSMAAIFEVTRRLGFLSSLHSVGRSSLGAIYYPIGVWLLFLLSADQPWRYATAASVLAISDGMAALVGKRCGRKRYEFRGSQKTLEGSLAFFASAFVIVLSGRFAFLGDVSWSGGEWMAALLASLLATGAEAVCSGGLDNIAIPMAVFATFPVVGV